MGKIKLSALWWLVIAYQLFVFALLVVKDSAFILQIEFILPRIILVIGLLLRLRLVKLLQISLIYVFDAVLIYGMLGMFYGETAHLNTLIFSKIDAELMMADQLIFGFQPAELFSQLYNSPLFSELMFLGYFSYYLMPIVALLAIGIKRAHKFEYAVFLIIGSFFIYYLIFILLPAEGPQYYWEKPLNTIEGKGLFAYLVKTIQAIGEAPTAAFPSSHVGVTGIILYLLFDYKMRLFWVFIPFAFLLVLATVYIKAHYAIDVIAGLVSIPIVIIFANWMYKKFKVFTQEAQV